jgi:sugar phosphate isomerase/epimerase
VQIGLYRDSVAQLGFEQALDFAADLGIQTVEIAAEGVPRAVTFLRGLV